MRKQYNKKITIDDVASRCGVSKSTISNYLNGKYYQFSEETRIRISNVIEELGYSPDKSAQRLKASRTRLIGCIIANVGSPFSDLLLKGITSVCERANYQVLFVDCNEDPACEVRALDSFLKSRVDGLIVNTTGENDSILLSIRESGTPVVLADRELLSSDDIDVVTHNNRETAYNCVKFLKECGYERIAFFTSGNKRVSPRIFRYEGYKQAIDDFFPGSEYEYYEFDREDEVACVRHMESFRNKYPGKRIAILTANGRTTLRLVFASVRAGYNWGENFGLCSFDDWDWMRLFIPRITSVQVPSLMIGEKAAELLLSYIEDGSTYPCKPQHIEVPGFITVRETTVKKES